MRRITLSRYLIEEQREKGKINADLRLLIEVVARACKSIAVAIGKGGLGGVLGKPVATTSRAKHRRSSTSSPTRSSSKPTNGAATSPAWLPRKWSCRTRSRTATRRAIPAALRSARRLVEHRHQRLGRYHLLGAALPEGADPTQAEAFMQPGTQQLAAGYAVLRSDHIAGADGRRRRRLLHPRPRAGAPSC